MFSEKNEFVKNKKRFLFQKKIKNLENVRKNRKQKKNYN